VRKLEKGRYTREVARLSRRVGFLALDSSDSAAHTSAKTPLAIVFPDLLSEMQQIKKSVVPKLVIPLDLSQETSTKHKSRRMHIYLVYN